MALEWREVVMRESGFTLVEIMIALTIFSIGVLSIIGMFIIAGKGIAGGNRSFTAVQMAKAQMELLRASPSVSDTASDLCSTGSTPAIECTYSIKKNTPSENLSTLEVIATWNEGDRERKLVLTSLRFDGNN